VEDISLLANIARKIPEILGFWYTTFAGKHLVVRL
jgi:hypothetical protein